MDLDIDKLFSNYFEEMFMNENKNKFDEVIKHISECKDEFVLNTNLEDIMDTVRKRNLDSSIMIDNEIKLIDNGIYVTYNFRKFWDLIKNSIPKSIKKISLPFHHGGFDIESLSVFKDLEELTLNDYGVFEINDIDYICDNTNINRIFAKYIYSLKGKEDTTSTYDIVVYKNILIKDIDKENESEVFIETSKLDKDQIKIILDYYTNINSAYLSIDNDRYKIEFNNKEINIEVSSNEVEHDKEVRKLFDSLGYKVK